MILLALLLIAQAQSGPWDKYKPNPFDKFDAKPAPERLGPGPHTLVITDGTAMTRLDYRSGALCLRARDETRRQVAPPANQRGVIYGPARVMAFCVPR